MTRKEYYELLITKRAECQDPVGIAEIDFRLEQLAYVPERHAVEHVTAKEAKPVEVEAAPAKRRPGRPPRRVAA